MHTENPKQEVFAASAGLGQRLLTADQTFTSQTAAAITGLSLAVGSAETWSIRARLLTLGVAGGGKLSVSTPASPTLIKQTVKGPTSGITAYSTDTVTAVDTLSAAYQTAAVTGIIEVDIIIVNGPTAGTVQLNCANVTSTNIFTVQAGSTMVATRVA